MSQWYVQLGVNMNQNSLEMVSHDVEQLIADTKKLLSDVSGVSTQGVADLKTESVSLLEKALERLNESKHRIEQASDYACCKVKT
jgi:ElaB/YqjD/DUF883 family membrane-anchored ribosome-binding protein